MTEHLSPQRLDGFRRGTLAPEDLLSADDHLADCEICRSQLAREGDVPSIRESLQRDLRRLAWEERDHLTWETLADLVDRRLGEVEREAAQSHMEVCPACAVEARDLREFAAALTAGKNPRESVLPFARFGALRIPVWMAAAASVLALFGWMLTIPLRRQVADLQGQVAELRTEAARPRPVVMALNEPGGPLVLDDSGALGGLDAAPKEIRNMLADVLHRPRVDTPPLLAGLIGKPGKLLGGGEDRPRLTLLAPVGTVVATDRPTFRWLALNGATEYRVAVFDENLNLMAGGRSLKRETTWVPPRPLPRGRTCSWQVTAIMRGGVEATAPAPPAPEAKFAVLDEVHARDLAQALQSGTGSHLAAGLLYARSGLLDEAESELSALFAANPTSSVASALLDEVRALRRDRNPASNTAKPAE